MWESGRVPYEAKKEGRTAGNALGQSYGLLNNRAGIEFQERVFKSDHRYKIVPCSHIHDAQYFIIDDCIDTVSFINKELVECMEWQQLPEIQHPTVKLGGELDIFYPSWAHGITLPNGASKEEIFSICDAKSKKAA
jgi:DNA polymerase-1